MGGAADAVPAGGLSPFRVQARYLLLDEHRYAKNDLLLRNFVAALFRLEQARSEEDYTRVIQHLIEWLTGDEHERVRRSFELWLKRRLRARMPAATATSGSKPALYRGILLDLYYKQDK